MSTTWFATERAANADQNYEFSVNIEIVSADYSDAEHSRSIPLLLNQYASDPMGGGSALADDVKRNLVRALAQRPGAFSIIAYAGTVPVGLVNAFEGFSTFACKPLINIHDVFVHKDYRGNGIARRMLEKVEEIGQERGCCKLTLEVLENNDAARQVYRNFGFSDYELHPAAGSARFWQKPLSNHSD